MGQNQKQYKISQIYDLYLVKMENIATFFEIRYENVPHQVFEPSLPRALPVDPLQHPVELHGEIEERPHEPLGVQPLQKGPRQVEDVQQLLLRLDKREEAFADQVGEGLDLGEAYTEDVSKEGDK